MHKTQILSQCKRHKFYNNTQNTNFITMQKTQLYNNTIILLLFSAALDHRGATGRALA